MTRLFFFHQTQLYTLLLVFMLDTMSDYVIARWFLTPDPNLKCIGVLSQKTPLYVCVLIHTENLKKNLTFF